MGTRQEGVSASWAPARPHTVRQICPAQQAMHNEAIRAQAV